MTMNNLKKFFGQKIKSLREAHGLTQEQFAEKINLERDTISKIENGKRFPSCKTIESISEILNISYSELFNFKDFNNDFDFNKALILEISELSSEQQDFILSFIKLYKKTNKH